MSLGLPVFADVKFHDIPNTVAGAAREIARLGVAIFNVHASGGEAMMRGSEEAAASVDPGVKAIAVTVLTSMADDDLASVRTGWPSGAAGGAAGPAGQGCGLDGVVCSPREIEVVRRACGPDFLIVTPGVRPAGAAVGDQRRVTTPSEGGRRRRRHPGDRPPHHRRGRPCQLPPRAIAEEVAPARAA